MGGVCVRLGKFGRPPKITGVCMKGLHASSAQNTGRTKAGVVFCRACKEGSQARWYWARRLELYWVAMGISS